MHRTQVLVSSFVLLLSTSGTTGCSSSSSNGPTTPTAAVSFKNDVLPLFWTAMNRTVQDGYSCTTTSSCHGQTNEGELNFFLGDPTVPTPSSAVRALLVNVKSVEDPKMNFVTPGDPANSYIIYKLKNTQNTLANDCTNATTVCSDCTPDMPCGISMPYNQGLAPDDYIAVVSDWIAQGAPDN